MTPLQGGAVELSHQLQIWRSVLKTALTDLIDPLPSHYECSWMCP